MISFTTVEDSMDKKITGSDSFEAVRDYLAEINPEALLADGLEDALVGVCDRFGQPTLAAYEYDKCIEIFAKDMDDDTLGENDDPHTMAVKHFDFNVIGGWLGEHTPVFIRIYSPSGELYG